MKNLLRSSIAAALTVALMLPVLPGAAQAAGAKRPQAEAAQTLDLSARKRHYHRRGDSRAAMQMFGMFLGTVATIAAASEARRHRHRYYGHYGYPPPPPYGYYRYGPYYRY